jgi:hypothetical protein
MAHVKKRKRKEKESEGGDGEGEEMSTCKPFSVMSQR